MNQPAQKIDLTEFFVAMTEMVSPFRSHVNLRDANLNGCRVLGAGAYYMDGDMRRRVRKNHYLFSFLAKGDLAMNIEIDLKALAFKPAEYINNMIEGINSALKDMEKENRIIVVQKRPLASAVIQFPDKTQRE